MFSAIRSSIVLVLAVLAGVCCVSMGQAQGLDFGPLRLENSQGSYGEGKRCSGHHARSLAQDARLRTNKRAEPKVTSSQLRAQPKALHKDQQPEDPEEIASRQLNLARELKAEAEAAQQVNDRSRAQKLLDRVEDRLAQLIEKYAETDAANQAAALLKQVQAK